MQDKYINKFLLKKKLAFIVGGFGLIGSEATLALASAGAKVIIFDLNKQKDTKKILKKNRNIFFIKFDCRKLKKSQIALKNAMQRFGCPDIFINCSYPSTHNWKKSSFKEITLNNYEKNIKIHLNSYVWYSKIIGNEMVKRKISGSIILLSSIYGFLAQDHNVYKGTKMKENMTYSVIKGGIINYVRQMSSYYGKFKIRVNAISPGGLKGHVAGSSNPQNKTFVKNYISKVPLNRMCEPEDVASAILFMSSSASSYITGSNLMIDGGWSII